MFYYILEISDTLRKVRISIHTFPHLIGSSEGVGLIEKGECREEKYIIKPMPETGFSGDQNMCHCMIISS